MYGYYNGNTTRKAGIDDNGNCTGRDFYNTIHGGALSNNWYGMACWWSAFSLAQNETLEGDIKFDGWDVKWTTTPTGCSDQLDVQSGAAHEMGHIWGLAHTSGADADHPRLVMSPNLGWCDFDERRLAKGDYDGIKRLYDKNRPVG